MGVALPWRCFVPSRGERQPRASLGELLCLGMVEIEAVWQASAEGPESRQASGGPESRSGEDQTAEDPRGAESLSLSGVQG